MTAPAYEEHLRLRPGVYSATGADGELHLFRHDLWRRVASFGPVGAGGRAVLRRLAEGPCPPSELTAIGASDPEFLEALRSGGWVTTTLSHLGRPLYTVQPVRAPDPDVEQDIDHEVKLSGFAVFRREGEDILAEAPTSWAQVLIHDPDVAAMLTEMTRPLSTATLKGPLPEELIARLLRDLRWTGIAIPAGSDAESEWRLRQWRPHDLWFHSRSRNGNGGYFDAGFGRTKWGQGQFPPLPARREPYPGPAIDLRVPDLDEIRVRDLGLTDAIEERRSIREHDDEHPITVDQLAELLYRCARVRRVNVWEGVEYVDTPRPAGGGVDELELYPVVRNVAGLAPGMYHYDAHEHRLRLVRDPGPAVGRLLATASRAAATTTWPQVLIVVSARFGRVMWTYEEMPYALILKHVGVLFQTMYLVATAMGLAASGLGGGDAPAFNEATGADPVVEASVGEFMLGSRPSPAADEEAYEEQE